MEHYILKRRYRALFLDFRNYHNRTENKNIAEVIATGCVYSDSVVCCEDTCILIGTLYGYLYTPCVDVSLSVFLWGCGRPRKSNGQM